MLNKLERTEMKKAFVIAFPYTIPVLTGFLGLGAAYGILMQTKGYGFPWSVLMSAIAFCGSMQFVAINLLTTAFNPLFVVWMSLMVNARHVFYGISMLDKFRGLGKLRPFLILTLCDETFSVFSTVELPKGINRKYFYFVVSLLNYLYWVTGTFLGSLLGNIITFSTKGLDFVLTALFVVLFLEQWKLKANRLPGIIGLVSTVISLLIFGQNKLIIPAMFIILYVLMIGRKKICSYREFKH